MLGKLHVEMIYLRVACCFSALLSNCPHRCTRGFFLAWMESCLCDSPPCHLHLRVMRDVVAFTSEGKMCRSVEQGDSKEDEFPLWPHHCPAQRHKVEILITRGGSVSSFLPSTGWKGGVCSLLQESFLLFLLSHTNNSVLFWFYSPPLPSHFPALLVYYKVWSVYVSGIQTYSLWVDTGYYNLSSCAWEHTQDWTHTYWSTQDFIIN